MHLVKPKNVSLLCLLLETVVVFFGLCVCVATII